MISASETLPSSEQFKAWANACFDVLGMSPAKFMHTGAPGDLNRVVRAFRAQNLKLDFARDLSIEIERAAVSRNVSLPKLSAFMDVDGVAAE